MKKYSKKREAILEKIRSTKVHPSAEWVYTQLKPEIPDLSLATVYRNISEFVKDGVILRIGNVNGQERYDGNVVPHTHFICKSCGKVLDLDHDVDVNVDKETERVWGVEICGYEVTFYGYCPDCVEFRNSDAV